MTAILPFDLPAQQLPQPTDRLSDEFLHAMPAPVGLWMPSKLALAAADFTPLPQKHFGALNGGITTTAGGFGVLGAAWNGNGTSTYIDIANGSALPQGSTARSLHAVIYLRTITNGNNYSVIEQTKTGTQGFYFSLSSVGGVTYAFTDGVNAGNNVSLTAGQVPSLNDWHLVSFVFNGSLGYSYYIDGILTKSGSFGVAINTGATHAKMMGRVDGGSNTGYMDGLFAFGGIWATAHSAVQVSDLYSCLLTGEPYPLFQPQTAAMMMGSAAAPAITSPGWFIGGGIGSFIGC